MGLLVRLGRMFGKPGRPSDPPTATITERWDRKQGPQRGEQDADAPDEPSVHVHSVRVASPAAKEQPGEDASPVPRSRQELVEELSRNYREVVSLIRKVDTHLDEQRERSDALLAIAHRIDEALPSMIETPRVLRESIDTLRAETTQAIREASSGQTARLDRVHESLDVVATEVVKSGDAQSRLIHTMAEFRETLTDIGRSSDRTSEVLHSIDERRAEREDQLTRMLATSRAWMVAGLAVSVGLAIIAVSIAVVSLVSRAG